MDPMKELVVPASTNQNIRVKVQGDHLENLAKCSPFTALSELIWNALDADASTVTVTFERNGMDGISGITVSDNGSGMSPAEASRVFENLGGSWKREKRRTHQNRIIHGQFGEGRFRAFALGAIVRWESVALHEGRLVGTSIAGKRNSELFDLCVLPDEQVSEPGTTVYIDLPSKSVSSLVAGDAEQKLTQEFALYLRHYRGVRILIDGTQIDPAKYEDHSQDFDLGEVELEPGKTIKATLTIIEWRGSTSRALMLCDEDGFPIEGQEPRIHAPGFQFTAYLKSSYLRELRESNLLSLGGMSPSLNMLLDLARDTMRGHFRQRLIDRRIDAIQQWKADHVYPYNGAAERPVEIVERQVFDICALNMADHLPNFESTDPKQKKLAFRLLKEAIEANPSALQTILVEVLGLPKEKQVELADLLKQTTLSAVINASKVVADRLNFLLGLEELLFDSENKKRLLERTQLHRILASNTWLFGEEYNLTVDDESLNTVLERHLHELRGGAAKDTKRVLREDGSEGIVDLMLSAVTRQPDPIKREHLVVELKRPSQVINLSVLTQVQSYAFTVADDPRFKDTSTRWKFIAVSNDINKDVRRQSTQLHLPPGCAFMAEDQAISIWVYSWAQIIEAARARLEFFRRELDYKADQASAKEHLNKVYDKYLPTSFTGETQEQVVPKATRPAKATKGKSRPKAKK